MPAHAAPAPRSSISRRMRAGIAVVALTAGSVSAVALGTAGSATADAPLGTSYQPSTAQLATITNGTSAAPWNEWQGDPAGAAYSSVSPGTVLPTYTPGGATVGGSPNLSVMPGASSGTDGNSPYPSGVVGTPGPLAGYCGTGNQVTASAGTPARQPDGTTLPLAPAYFPHIVANADGSLTGYFDYRPKDADEAVEVGRSTDGGKDWTYQGEALEQDPGYCPSADTNDDGNGHPNVITVDGVTRLYTLQRAAGDANGVGMLVHTLTPTASNPLNGAPSVEHVGIDPNSFVSPGGGIAVPNTGGVTINVNSTGTAGSTLQLVAGGFVDLTVTPTPTASSVITCTGVTATSLTTCTSANPNGESVSDGDLIEQVIGYVGTGVTVPTGPNTTNGDGGLGTIAVVNKATGGTAGFTLPLTGTTYNNNAPNRAYVDGVAIYCDQANANPTTKMENCTTGTGKAALTVVAGDPITSDPINPATAAMTSGLVAPDGIVGVLPSYPGAPQGSTVVMYTEKELAYYVAGTTTNSSATKFSAASTIAFNPSPYTSKDLPATINAANPVTVSMGDITTSTIVSVTCTGLTVGSTDSLTGCTAPGVGVNDQFNATSLIGAPGATTVSQQTLAQTGEGSGVPSSAKNVAKLMKNNEDLTVLRVAYTTDGLNFQTAGLDNGGIISGQSNGATNYADISNPTANTSPANLNAYATPGTALATEMRWVGSAGSIITNPDGSYGLFLSGAWAADGDSDAFNQVFYSSSTDGEHWTVPTDVVSTDYTFAASAAQNSALAGGTDAPLGISAYYSGRAYGPSVVQNADGTLTMMFAGYRLPKTIANVGTVLGTNSAAPYTIGASDPTAYRNILVETLSSQTSPRVATTTAVTGSPSAPVTGQTVTYTATVSVPSPGTGNPTGTVDFADGSGTLCSAVALSSSDTATCAVPYSSATTDHVTATYSGDSNYATSNGSVDQTVAPAATTTTLQADPDSSTYGDGIALSGAVAVTDPGSGTPTGSVTIDDGSTQVGTATLSGGQYSLSISTLGAGDHSLTAVYAGDPNFAGSTSGAVDVTVAMAPDGTLSLITPATGFYGGTGTVSAVGGASSAPVVVTVDPSSASVCTLSGSTVSYTAVGNCVIDANQAGDANYLPADQVQQTITITKAPVTATIVGAAVNKATVLFYGTVTLPDGSEVVLSNVTCSTLAGGVPISKTLAFGTYPIDTSSCSFTPIVSATATIATVNGTFTASKFGITTPSLPNGILGTHYSKNLTSGGASGLQSWSLVGGALPTGFTMSSTGTIAGTPTVVGVSNFVVQDKTTSGQVSRWTYSITVPPMQITTTSVPNGSLGKSYSTNIAATGGKTPRHFAVTAGALPTGLVLSTTGTISGKPTASGTFTFTVTVSDSSVPANSASAVFTISVPTIAVTTTSLKSGKVKSLYSVTLTSNSAVTPLVWTVASGSLPPGLRLPTSGVLQGTPTAAGSYTFTIRVTDHAGNTATQTFTLTVTS